MFNFSQNEISLSNSKVQQSPNDKSPVPEKTKQTKGSSTESDFQLPDFSDL